MVEVLVTASHVRATFVFLINGEMMVHRATTHGPGASDRRTWLKAGGLSLSALSTVECSPKPDSGVMRVRFAE